MTLTPNFLPVGSIVEYNIGEHDTPEWEVNTIDFEDIRICVENNERFNRNYRPIPLTPEILTEWCGFEKVSNFEYFKSGITLKADSNGIFYDVHGNGMKILVFEHLHELQLFYSALTQTVLPIQIK